MRESKKINIENYINKYERRTITLKEIAKQEGVSAFTINRRINDYYKKKEKERPKLQGIKGREIDIEKYIPDYESGKLKETQIAEKLGVGIYIVSNRIEKYYANKGQKKPKIGVSIYVLEGLLKKGMTREQIREEAKKRNILIPDKYFDTAEKGLNKNGDER